MKPTDPGEFLANCNAGAFAHQIARALSTVAQGVVEFGDKGKKGKVVITLDISRISESHQVNVSHKLDFVTPTKRGKISEDTALDTPFHVTANGLQLFPENPTAGLFDKKQAPVTERT